MDFDFNKVKADETNTLNKYEHLVMDDSFEIPSYYSYIEEMKPVFTKITCTMEEVELINQFVRHWYNILVQPLLENIGKMKRHYETSDSYVPIDHFFSGQTDSIDLIVLRCNCIFEPASSIYDTMPINNMKSTWMRKMMEKEVSTLISSDPFSSWPTEIIRKFAVQILGKKLFTLYQKAEEMADPFIWKPQTYR